MVEKAQPYEYMSP